jgi:hypothetical protein
MKPNLLGRIAGGVAVALTATALLATGAQAKTPAAGYTQFTGCPTALESPGVEYCVHSVVTGGHLKMGSKDVPIENPITVTGGANEELEHFVANSQGGMSKAKQKVPGGVIGLTGLTWLAEVLGSEALTLYAVTELAGTPELSFSSLTLPLKVHLINSVLGNNCYIGSSSSPLTLHMIYGTTSPPAPNKPITGVEPTGGFNPSTGIISLSKGTYVDNSFSAPVANGCTLTLFGFIPIGLNTLVDAEAGLPAKAGTNETVQNINTELVEVGRVYP